MNLFYPGVVLLLSFSLSVRSLDCNPAENSTVLHQCFEEQSQKPNGGHITLKSGHNYATTSGSFDTNSTCKDHFCTHNSWHNYTTTSVSFGTNSTCKGLFCIQNSLSVNTTETAPAILVLNDISEEGFFQNGTIAIDNIDIQGQSLSNNGIFLKDLSNISIINCVVSGYNIHSSSTAFIKHAQTLYITNTTFHHNTVQSTETLTSTLISSVLHPVYKDENTKNDEQKIPYCNPQASFP